MQFIAGDIIQLDSTTVIIIEVHDTDYTYITPYNRKQIKANLCVGKKIGHLDLYELCKDCGLALDICQAYYLYKHGGSSGDRVTQLTELFGDDLYDEVEKETRHLWENMI